MKKESRFWKKGIKVLLAIGLLGSMLVPTSAMANEYVTPSDAETDDSHKTQGTFIFYTLDENGSPKEMQTIKKDVDLGNSTYKDIGIEFPTATYKNLNFLGWIGQGGNTVDENTTIYNSYNVLYPKFDKVVTRVSFKYLDSSNNIKEVTEPYMLEHGATFQDLVDQCLDYRASDISKEDTFSEWTYDQSYADDMNDKIGASGDSFKLEAEFKNKKVLEIEYNYYNKYGLNPYEFEIQFVDKSTTFEDFAAKLNKSPLPESFKGLRASGWSKPYAYGRHGSAIDTTVKIDTGVIKSYDTVHFSPNYENHIVKFIIDETFRPSNRNLRGAMSFDESKADYIYAMVAEKGETITVPEIKEYSNIKWVITQPEGDNLVINRHTTFYGYGDKVDVPVVNPDDGDNDNNGTDVPDVTLPEEEINNAVDEVKNAAKGDTVSVDMKDNVTLPVEVLESARGKDVEVVFNMGAYSWSINGLDITADTLKAINLEVKLNANAISADVVKTLAGDRPTMQLSLSHNGEFGFKAKLQVNLGAEHKGKYGNLYYYNKDGKLEFMNAGKIDENGNVSLEFTHASDYVVVIDEKSMAATTENPIQDTASNVGGNGLVGMLMLVAIGGTCYLATKKAKAK